jgi:hypothetical protein
VSNGVDPRVYYYFREIQGKTREIMVDSRENICKIREIKPSPGLPISKNPLENGSLDHENQ